MRAQPATAHRARATLILLGAAGLGSSVAAAAQVRLDGGVDLRVTAIALMMLAAFLSGVQGLGTD